MTTPYNGPWRDTWIRIANRNPWLRGCWDPSVADSLCAFDSPRELWDAFQCGNWALGCAFAIGEICFINQVNGGDEWLTICRDVAFESMTARACFPDVDSLSRFCRAVSECTPRQLLAFDYDY